MPIRVKVTDENCGLSLGLRLWPIGLFLQMLTRRSKPETTKIAGCGHITTTSCNLGLMFAFNGPQCLLDGLPHHHFWVCVSPKPDNAMTKPQFLPTIIVDNALHFPT